MIVVVMARGRADEGGVSGAGLVVAVAADLAAAPTGRSRAEHGGQRPTSTPRRRIHDGIIDAGAVEMAPEHLSHDDRDRREHVSTMPRPVITSNNDFSHAIR
jgi:hypothetical protein